jgi:hypothetical protein
MMPEREAARGEESTLILNLISWPPVHELLTHTGSDLTHGMVHCVYSEIF